MLIARTTQTDSHKSFGATPFIFALYFISGSDVRSVTIIVASYLLGLGLGNLLGGSVRDRTMAIEYVKSKY